LCGHYEGIDERVIEEIVTDEVSLGDFVLTGGELPAMVMIDCISRLIPGVLGSEDSAEDESFSDGLLEYPQYTRPEEWKGKSVPSVLLSGNHKEIEKWRTAQALDRTREKRPDLYEKVKNELEKFKEDNPRKFRKDRSEAEELLKMRELLAKENE
nr:tRNA (guanosine(37)-N1)-methyltransferase TrmD [Lachnospiraceae bacterium]